MITACRVAMHRALYTVEMLQGQGSSELSVCLAGIAASWSQGLGEVL